MGRAYKRKAVSRKERKGRKVKQNNYSRWLNASSGVILFFAILAAIPFGFGKYIEFNFPGPYDSGGYVYSAAHILEGAEIGTEERPSAKLGTLLFNMLGVALLGYRETGPKLMQMLMQAAALVMMFIAMRKLFGNLPAGIGVFTASFLLSSPLIAKFGNTKEQYMIAFMVLGISCFILYQLGGRWWWAVLSGLFLSWAPLFKPTGTTAIGATGLFVILQPFLKHRTFKQTGKDILLLFGGAAIGMGPLYLWILAWDVKLALPYSFAWRTLVSLIPTSVTGEEEKAGVAYVVRARKLVPFAKQWPRVLRHYWMLRLPIFLALGSVILRLIRAIARRFTDLPKTPYDRLVLLLGVWWFLDMAFVWISSRSYEQYYLPLTASGAMLGGYMIALYRDKFNRATANKKLWAFVGLAGAVVMIAFSWHIVFGIKRSPYSGTEYPEKKKGYVQRFKIASQGAKVRYPWQAVGEYIRMNSEPGDKMYVWGWYPGIYVAAQRFAPTPHACTMPRPPPDAMGKKVKHILERFRQEPPKFIVDSRKNHVPLTRPPYELWPIVPKGFRGAEQKHFIRSKEEARIYDSLYSKFLRNQFDEAEAARYENLKPLREFIMDNYRIVDMYGPHVLFQLKEDAPVLEQKKR